MRKVLYFAVLDQGYHAQVLRGVMRHARSRPWSVSLGCWAYSDFASLVDLVRPDGVILNVVNNEWVGHLARRGIPFVNVGYNLEVSPTITTDADSEAALAMEHLVSRGFRRFAYFGPPDIPFSSARARAFAEHLRRRRYDCIDAGQMWACHADQWVRSLPKPIAVLASNDNDAFRLIQLGREVGVRVPEEMAIVGADNSQLSLMCAPTLTSIATPCDLIGQRSAEMLDRLIDGEPAPREPMLLPPLGLVVRHSTDATGELESDLAQVVRYIRDNARRRLSVADVLRAVPVSRRCLERRFRAELGRGVYDEIRAARMEEVKQMLLSTDLPLCVIADETGYGTAANLSMVFRKTTGHTPGEFRRQFRIDAACHVEQ